jgi:hypothetical protein
VGSSNIKMDFLPAPAPPPGGQPIGETGQLTIAQSSASSWQRVNLSRTYDSPIVVFGPLTSMGGDPAMVRVRNVTPTSFEWQLDEWDYLDGAHPLRETVGYLVVEAGTHTLAGGQKLVAGSVTTDQRFKPVFFSGFTAAPAVFATVTSTAGGSAVTTRIRNVTANRFEVRLQEEERNDDLHAVETIGYVAMGKGSGQIAGLDFLSGSTGNSVTQQGFVIRLGNRFASPPVFLGNIQSYQGIEPVALRMASLTASSARVVAQEEQSQDAELTHPAEDVSYLAIEKGTIYATDSAAPPVNSSPTVDNQTFSVANNVLDGATVGTVVARDPDNGDSISLTITGGNTNNAFSMDSNSGRLTVADPSKLTVFQFQLTVRAQDSQGATDSATVTINVQDAASVALGEAGTVTAGQSGPGQWHRVQLQRSYTNPIVIVGPLSYNGGHASNVRVRRVTTSSFEWQIDEWDYLDGGHAAESAGYLVVEAGTHVLPDGTRIVAGKTYSDHRFAPVALPNLNGIPVVLATVATVNGGTAVVPRLRDVSGTGFEIRLQEEQASDGLHAIESMHYVAIEQATGTVSSRRFMSGRTGNTVSHAGSGVSFGSHFSSTPVFVASVQTYVGSDPTGLRRKSLDRTGAQFFLEEELSADMEVSHAGEAVGFFAVDAGLINSDASSRGLRRDETTVVDLVFEHSGSTPDERDPSSRPDETFVPIECRRPSELEDLFFNREDHVTFRLPDSPASETDVDLAVGEWSSDLDLVVV